MIFQPKLRFPSFEGNWTSIQLDSSVELTSGNAFKSDFFGDIGRKLITPQNFTKTGTANFKKTNTKYTSEECNDKYVCADGDLLVLLTDLTSTCELLGKPIVLNKSDGQVLLNQRIVRIETKKPILKLYLAQFLQTEKCHRIIKNSATGTTVRHSSNKILKSLFIDLPSEKEQQKIADFLSAVDKKISFLKEKYVLLEQYKKGVIQKLFSQELRFKDENSNDFPDWVKGVLGDLSDKISNKNKDESVTNVLTNSAKSGIVSQTDYFKKNIANENNLAGYSVVEKNDFVYNPRISVLAPVGPIKRNHVGQGVMSPLYTVFRFKDEDVLDYLELYFETTQWHRYMNSIANFGARHDRMNITMGDFFNLPIRIPSQNEREKIVGFIQALDKKMRAVGQQIEQTQTFKKGLLQQMFV